jgi:hypothetical protein
VCVLVCVCDHRMHGRDTPHPSSPSFLYVSCGKKSTVCPFFCYRGQLKNKRGDIMRGLCRERGKKNMTAAPQEEKKRAHHRRNYVKGRGFKEQREEETKQGSKKRDMANRDRLLLPVARPRLLFAPFIYPPTQVHASSFPGRNGSSSKQATSSTTDDTGGSKSSLLLREFVCVPIGQWVHACMEWSHRSIDRLRTAFSIADYGK